MKLCIPQVLNAVSLVSPLFFWLRHKKKIGNTLVHRFVALHLPISFLYHFLKGVCWNGCITNIAKMLDYACIHSYAIICCSRRKRLRTTCIFGNVYCIHHSIFYNPYIDDPRFTFARLSVLAMSAHQLASATSKQRTAFLQGTVCSCFFVMDECMYSYGHCLFHLVLGGLYDSIFHIIAETLCL
jgi:hypothetical protein